MTKKLMKKVVSLAMALLILTPVFAFSLPALAVEFLPFGSDDDVNGTNFANNAGLPGEGTNLRGTIESIIAWIMVFLGIIAVIVILIGGFKWMTAGGNEDKVGEAKKLLISGLIGLVIVVLAYAIAVFVLTQLIEITNNP